MLVKVTVLISKYNVKISWSRTNVLKLKTGLYAQKAFLPVCFDICTHIRVTRHKLLSRNQTITEEFYCRQLYHLNSELEEKRQTLVTRYRVLLHQSNVEPHVKKRYKNCKTSWEFKLFGNFRWARHENSIEKVITKFLTRNRKHFRKPVGKCPMKKTNKTMTSHNKRYKLFSR